MHPVLKAFILIIHVQIIDRFSPSGPEYQSCQIQLNHLLLNAFRNMRFAVFPISIVNEHQNCAEGPFFTGCIIQPANEERKMLIAKELRKWFWAASWIWLRLDVARVEASLVEVFGRFTPVWDREVFLQGAVPAVSEPALRPASWADWEGGRWTSAGPSSLCLHRHQPGCHVR